MIHTKEVKIQYIMTEKFKQNFLEDLSHCQQIPPYIYIPSIPIYVYISIYMYNEVIYILDLHNNI